MRNAQFEVPASCMPDFTKKLLKSELDYEIVKVNKQEEIVIEVKYTRDEIEAVDELEAYLEELIEDEDFEDEEDEDDED